MERAGEVAAQDLDVAAREGGGEVEEGSVVLVDEGHRAAAGLEAAEFVEEAHAAQDGEVGVAAEVDGVAAFAQGGGEFDDGGAEAVVAEAVGEGRAGDARAGDEDGGGGRCGHGIGLRGGKGPELRPADTESIPCTVDAVLVRVQGDPHDE